MKKLLCILIAMMMFAFLLSSCNNGNETPGTDDPNAHTHSFGDWSIEKQATCGEAGLFSRICSTCGEIESQNIAPTGTHRQVEDASVAATCTSAGLTSGVHCGDCGLVIMPQSEIPVTDHVFSSENDGTCNKCGFYRDIICAHDALITISGVAPTCTTSGLTEGKKCNNCGDMITEQSEIPALGHTEVVEAAKPATCTSPVIPSRRPARPVTRSFFRAPLSIP